MKSLKRHKIHMKNYGMIFLFVCMYSTIFMVHLAFCQTPSATTVILSTATPSVMTDEQWLSNFDMGGRFSEDTSIDEIDEIGKEIYLNQEQIGELKKFHELCKQTAQAGMAVERIDTRRAAATGKHKYGKVNQSEMYYPDEATKQAQLNNLNSGSSNCLSEVKIVRGILGEKEQDLWFLMRERGYVEAQAMMFSQLKRKDPNLEPEDYADSVFQKFISGKGYQDFRARREESFGDRGEGEKYFNRLEAIFETKLMMDMNGDLIRLHVSDVDKTQFKNLREKAKAYKSKIDDLLNQ